MATSASLGKKPQLAWLPVERLGVDPKYQRDTGSLRSRRVIEKIAVEFRWARFGVVMVVAQGGQRWHVIDGQHRVEAARRRGDVTRVPALVLPHATLAEAAADFVAINRDRVVVTPLHIYHAELVAGGAEALAIDRVCRDAGVEICRYPVASNRMNARQTVAVASIGRLVRLAGEDFTVKVLRQCLAQAKGAGAGVNARAIAAVALERGLIVRGGQVVTSRKCLGCGNWFPSEGVGNRMCNTCRRTA